MKSENQALFEIDNPTCSDYSIVDSPDMFGNYRYVNDFTEMLFLVYCTGLKRGKL